MDTAEKVIALCRERKIPISTLEKACGFSNAYIKGRIGGKIPPDRIVKIAEFLHVHPSELEPTIFPEDYSNPKYSGVVRRMSEDKVFEDLVFEFYGMSSNEIINMEEQYQRLAEYAKRISELPSIYMQEKKEEDHAQTQTKNQDA